MKQGKSAVALLLAAAVLFCPAYAAGIPANPSGLSEDLLADAAAIAPSGNLNDDTVLPGLAPRGSSVSWKSSVAGLFDENGVYLPQIGSGSFYVTLTATLQNNGEALVKTFRVLSFRKPEYRINGLVYAKADHSTVRTPRPAVRVSAVTVEKNPRVTTNALLFAGVYREGRLISVGMNQVDKSGDIPLSAAFGGGVEAREARCFLLENARTLRPLAEPFSVRLDEEPDGFMSTMTAKDGGTDAPEAVDGDQSTAYTFSTPPSIVDNGDSLFLKKTVAGTESQLAAYSFSQLQGTIRISYSFLVTEAEGEKGIFYAFDNGNNHVFSLMISGTDIQNQSTQVAYSGVQPYRWYNAEIILYTGTREADVWIDGVLRWSKRPFRTAASELSKLQFHISPAYLGGLYLDNVVVKDDGAVVLSENFENKTLQQLKNSGWTLSPNKETLGQIQVSEFTDHHLSMYPQALTVDIGRECDIQALRLVLPDHLRTRLTLQGARKEDEYFRLTADSDAYQTGERTFPLGRARVRYLRITIYDVRDTSDAHVSGVIHEVLPVVASDSFPENIAPAAHVSVTSQYSVLYDKRGLYDGIVSEFNKTGGWLSRYEANPTVYLSWDEPQMIDEILLFNNVAAETAGGAVITFDGGETLEADGIPADGTPRLVSFPPRKVSWLSVRLRDTTGANAGLSELQVLKSGAKSEKTEYVTPWRIIELPAGYAGQWVVSDDLDGDGEPELVIARGLYEYSNHAVATVCVQKLDGTVLWTWGVPGAGQEKIGSDLPCQIHDIDNDGTKEILLSTKDHLIILNSLTGGEIRRHALPQSEQFPGEWSSDAISFADISGKGYAGDILVKTRYTDVWAYTGDWELIWHVCYPNGMMTAHFPTPLDIDHDGKEEIFAGFAFVDEDGSLTCVIDPAEYSFDLRRGHVDQFTPIRFEAGMPREQMRFAVSPCGAQNFFIIDGNGKKIWAESNGLHYETIISGRFTDGGTEVQLLTNPSNAGTASEFNAEGYQPFAVYNSDGSVAAWHYGYTATRYVHAVNWDANGKDYIYLPADNLLTDAHGNIRVKLLSQYRHFMTSMKWSYPEGTGYGGDMDGDKTTDIVSLATANNKWYVYIYQNINGRKTAQKPGTGYNYTYY